MAENPRKGLFRKRNVLGTALVAGIGLGVYLGGFKGPGFGGGGLFGIGARSGDSESRDVTEVDRKSAEKPLESDQTSDDATITVSDVLKVVVDEKTFLVRQPGVNVPVELSKLIRLVKQAPGDSDGVRIRIYLKSTARASAEEKLKEALVTARIPNEAIFWVPTPVK